MTSDLVPRGARGEGPVMIAYALRDDDDPTNGNTRDGSLARPGAHFALPREFSQTPHPDILALTWLCLFRPFIGSRLAVDTPVSQLFADAVFAELGIEISPVSTKVDSRVRPNGPDSLAFSGGVDSCVALHLSPVDTISLFLNRTSYLGSRPGLYRADAAWRTVRAVRKSRRTVLAVDTNLEHIRKPVGFPIDLSNAVPSLLLADSLDLGSVGFGDVSEWAYDTGLTRYVDVEEQSKYRPWRTLFEAVGLPLSMPTGGMSEILTSRIAVESLGRWHPQSCIRGTATEPCGRCNKCFRKMILTAAIKGETVSNEHFDRNMASREVAIRLQEVPISQENVLAYAVHGAGPTQHKFHAALLELTAQVYDYGDGLEMFTRLFTPALAMVPDHLRTALSATIARYAQPMTESEVTKMRAWDLTEINASERKSEARRVVARLMSSVLPA